ncbi:MAG: sensor histidine kinase, partial [Gemmatimonadota bacterium]
RSAELRASELQTRLAEARLRSLRWHLQPHFLFNTLHTIGVLTRKQENEKAVTMVTGLGDLLRHSLERGDQEVSLEEEIAFVRRYLEVEQVRFGDRLAATFEVETGVLGAQVPNLVLQPLVEAAIRNGVAPYRAPGRIRVLGRADGEWLELRVRDETGCPDASRTGREARGGRFEDLEGRLRSFYGDRFRIVAAEEEGGRSYTVTIRIPLIRTPRGSVAPAADEDPPDAPGADPRQEPVRAAGGRSV